MNNYLAKRLILAFIIFSHNIVFAGWDITNTGIPYKEATITTQEGTWMSVDVSPDGETLVFDMLGDIYTMPSSGGKSTLIMEGSALDRQPRFSPDGKQLVFTSDRSGMFNVWVSDLDGNNARQISSELGNKISSANWSPDGEYIVASSIGYGIGKPDWWFSIDLFNINGGNGRSIVTTPSPAKRVNEPVFSKDGKYLFYTNMLTLVRWDADLNQPNYAIEQLDLQTGEKETILTGFGSAVSPQVSPDGKMISFIRHLKDKTVLFIYDRESRRETPIYDQLSGDIMASPGQDGFYPQYNWFPDNKSIAIWAMGKLRKINVESATAEVIPFTASAIHRFSQVARYQQKQLAPESFNVQAIHQITTSMNGKEVVFSALGALWKKSLPDGQPKRLTQSSEFEFEPSYSPDGKKIVYVAWDDEKGAALKVVSARGGSGKIIAKSAGTMRAPVWSNDQKKIAWFVDQPDDTMSGYRGKAGFYWVSSKGGSPVWVGEGEYPSFSQNNERIYFNTARLTQPNTELKSRRLDGLDERVHAKSGIARDFKLSPDGKWLAFSQYENLYITPYIETGLPMSIHQNSQEMKVAKVTKYAGWGGHWSADSRKLNWVFGDEYYTANLEQFFPSLGDNTKTVILEENGIALGLIAKSDVPEGSIAFTNARIITMEGDKVIENGTVLISGNRIMGVGKNINIPNKTKVINLEGKSIMPGLIDAHGHLTLHKDGLTPQKHPSFYAAAAFGVTTNFDVSSDDHIASTIRELIQTGRMVGPRYLGTGAVALGGADSSIYATVDTVGDARSYMRRKKELGFIAIKSYRQPKRNQKQKLIKAALENKLMVMPEGEFNIYNRIGMILDGHTTIEHNDITQTLYDDWIQLYAKSDTAHTPTLVVTGGGELFGENYFYGTTKPWQDPKVKSFVKSTFSLYSPLKTTPSQPVWVRGMHSIVMDESLWDVSYREAAKTMKKLSDAGVLINTGGHGQINGLAMHWEMWMLYEGGMTALETLRAATMNPATTLGLEEQIGSIKVGKLADLIILDQNPLDNIRNTNSVSYTMLNGRLYDSYSMDEVGNYDRPRSKFFWELPNYNGIDWNETESGVDMTKHELSLEKHNH